MKRKGPGAPRPGVQGDDAARHGNSGHSQSCVPHHIKVRTLAEAEIHILNLVPCRLDDIFSHQPKFTKKLLFYGVRMLKRVGKISVVTEQGTTILRRVKA